MSQRTDRVDQLLREEIGTMLEREVADPRIGFATVTEVETTPDLRHARVWVSVIGGASERTQTIAGLEHAMIFIRRELGTRLRLKRIPDLHVRLDDSIERGTRVLKLIDSLEAGAEPSEVGDGESLPTPSRRPASADSAMTGTPSAEGFGAAAAEYAAELAERRRAARHGRGAAAREDRPGHRSGHRPSGRGG
ncbi:MAG TPA: 30S ribosome-binding factor RbfA [Candidatus Limnocylindria bacterium]|nr:30S ribosome-binding factor RbfA [Candidatus Limnocylindria bacterium]